MNNRYRPDNLTTLIAAGLLLLAAGGDFAGMLAFSGIALIVTIISFQKNKKNKGALLVAVMGCLLALFLTFARQGR
ncbi:hypothetical protein [Pelotomaculum propionicicum]|uniref:Uncharacterized protein n=1 Tax=Pelotomaculum propionicicum TaxID=258475 RepID=A0A4Y7RR82_9FIRM|nr:hypothetical protein [Pelotomaculum propionicicum]TEB11276.1 hypothetical protein Pmgp_01811 [Pelotomaculum propionicicum]